MNVTRRMLRVSGPLARVTADEDEGDDADDVAADAGSSISSSGGP